MTKIVWDTENNMPAINCDGSEPEIDGDVILIKEIGCNCAPPGCGGCVIVVNDYEIGNSQYIWKEI